MGGQPSACLLGLRQRVYGVWYGLAPGPAELRAEAQGTYLPPRQLDLAPGKIEQLTAELAPGPDLEVEVDVPAALRGERLTVEIRRLPGGEVLARKPIAHRQTFEGLPPAPLAVELKTSLGPFVREADLRSGEKGYLLLKPELIALRGVVYHGEEGHPAKLTFTTVGRKEVQAQADEKGAYEAVLLDPARSVSIELAGVEQEPYADVFWEAVDKSRELDFHLPNVHYAVKVVDSATGQGIAQAAVMIRNTYRPESPAETGGKADGSGDRPEPSQKPAQRERVLVQRASTGESGLARLPPLRRGILEVQASAEGYLPMHQPLKELAIDGKTDRTFEIALEPVGSTAALRLRLPDGVPAAGAEVMLIDSVASGQSLYTGRADGKGVVQLPRDRAGIVLARHAGAAFLVRQWRPRAGDAGGAETAWDLPPVAERPLTVHIREAPEPEETTAIELAVWAEGYRLSGPLLAWLTGGRPFADPSGYWQGANLPRGPVAVLAWQPSARAKASAGSLDSQATTAEYPWPDPVEVRVQE